MLASLILQQNQRKEEERLTPISCSRVCVLRVVYVWMREIGFSKSHLPFSPKTRLLGFWFHQNQNQVVGKWVVWHKCQPLSQLPHVKWAPFFNSKFKRFLRMYAVARIRLIRLNEFSSLNN